MLDFCYAVIGNVRLPGFLVSFAKPPEANNRRVNSPLEALLRDESARPS